MLTAGGHEDANKPCWKCRAMRRLHGGAIPALTALTPSETPANTAVTGKCVHGARGPTQMPRPVREALGAEEVER